ncbi:CDP-diglyceride synthetase [secondary endosymbiont of Heteropsylla cubana]|uniref:Phosphatidate cytidylyltransferase n=1 Tax=secondary endosymbiont of Heteropsylla cubana TaxID=134287 RepID=J3VUF9_9ENTR|nr:phosphatidate cytidylyltransferase [secondary endosymbiont of Heteropsylla cubana]AFP85791.1 CDP-diglyceride synthetase [secondary endosymbiont of Heteropsylla cubana]
MKYRLISSFILINIVIAAMFLLSLRGFSLAVGLVCILSMWEWGKLSGLTSFKKVIILKFFFGFCLIFITKIIHPDLPYMNFWQVRYIFKASIIWWILAFILVFFYPRSARLWIGSQALRLIFGFLTIIPFCLGVLILRQYRYDINEFSGAWLLLYLMVLIWSADSCGYIFGCAMGCHKLAPNVSPNKTWEGLLGGLLISTMLVFLLGKYVSIGISPLRLIIGSIVAILASVIGDLSESMFKRASGVKNSGYLIPGHGGILDRIDSLTAAVPVFLCLILEVF